MTRLEEEHFLIYKVMVNIPCSQTIFYTYISKKYEILMPEAYKDSVVGEKCKKCMMNDDKKRTFVPRNAVELEKLAKMRKNVHKTPFQGHIQHKRVVNEASKYAQVLLLLSSRRVWLLLVSISNVSITIKVSGYCSTLVSSSHYLEF